jgi:hypothetical protein
MAQENMEVKDVQMPTSKGTQPGYSVFIKDATLDMVSKKWGQYMRNENSEVFKSKDYKVKYEFKAGEYLAERAVLTGISNKYISTIATVVNTNGGVQFTAFFQLDSAFISKQTLGDIYPNTKKYVRKFAVESYRDAVAAELAREDKKLKDLEEKLVSLKDKKLLLEKEIVRSQAGVSEMESLLRTNMTDQERTGQNVKMLNDSLSRLPANSPEYTVYNNRLKEENKIQKRLISDNSSYHKKLDNQKRSILEDQEAVKKNVIDQDYQVKLIESQKVVVNNVKVKLGNIK